MIRSVLKILPLFYDIMLPSETYLQQCQMQKGQKDPL